MLKKLIEKDTPILLADNDGLRVVTAGNTTPIRKGGLSYPFVVQENPTLLAEIAYTRSHRRVITEANLRKFS